MAEKASEETAEEIEVAGLGDWRRSVRRGRLLVVDGVWAMMMAETRVGGERLSRMPRIRVSSPMLVRIRAMRLIPPPRMRALSGLMPGRQLHQKMGPG